MSKDIVLEKVYDLGTNSLRTIGSGAGDASAANQVAGNATLTSINAKLVFFPPATTDAITATYPDAVTEVFRYRTGGVSGTILQTITVIYTDSSKVSVSSVVKS